MDPGGSVAVSGAGNVRQAVSANRTSALRTILDEAALAVFKASAPSTFDDVLVTDQNCEALGRHVGRPLLGHVGPLLALELRDVVFRFQARGERLLEACDLLRGRRLVGLVLLFDLVAGLGLFASRRAPTRDQARGGAVARSSAGIVAEDLSYERSRGGALDGTDSTGSLS